MYQTDPFFKMFAGRFADEDERHKPHVNNPISIPEPRGARDTRDSKLLLETRQAFCFKKYLVVYLRNWQQGSYAAVFRNSPSQIEIRSIESYKQMHRFFLPQEFKFYLTALTRVQLSFESNPALCEWNNLLTREFKRQHVHSDHRIPARRVQSAHAKLGSWPDANSPNSVPSVLSRSAPPSGLLAQSLASEQPHRKLSTFDVLASYLAVYFDNYAALWEHATEALQLSQLLSSTIESYLECNPCISALFLAKLFDAVEEPRSALVSIDLGPASPSS